MKIDLKFKENAQRLDLGFGQYQDLTDGGYERGYEAGYTDGNLEGYNKGHDEGYKVGYADGKVQSAGGDKAIEIVNKTVTQITPEDITNMGITYIPDYCFFSCKNLQSFVSTKEQKIDIRTAAFNDCTTLKEVYANSIALAVFSGCIALEKVVFWGHTEFGAFGVFAKCSALKIIDMRYCTKVPFCHRQAFESAAPTDCKIIVPDNLYDDWIVKTNWVDLLDRGFTIVKASEYVENEEA